jgi:hypothetical protein
LVIGANIGHAAGDGDAGKLRVGFHFGDGIFADDPGLEAGHGVGDLFVHLGEIPAEAVDVGVVVHRAAENDGGLRFL